MKELTRQSTRGFRPQKVETFFANEGSDYLLPKSPNREAIFQIRVNLWIANFNLD